jgi:hypothetical protein
MKKSNISLDCIGKLEGHYGRVTALAIGEDSNKKTILVSGSRVEQ